MSSSCLVHNGLRCGIFVQFFFSSEPILSNATKDWRVTTKKPYAAHSLHTNRPSIMCDTRHTVHVTKSTLSNGRKMYRIMFRWLGLVCVCLPHFTCLTNEQPLARFVAIHLLISAIQYSNLSISFDDDDDDDMGSMMEFRWCKLEIRFTGTSSNNIRYDCHWIASPIPKPTRNKWQLLMLCKVLTDLGILPKILAAFLYNQWGRKVICKEE